MPATDLTRNWGKRLAEHRTEAGMSAADLAAAVGVSRTHIYKLEAGDHAPSDALRVQLAAALSTTVTDLFPYEAAA